MSKTNTVVKTLWNLYIWESLYSWKASEFPNEHQANVADQDLDPSTAMKNKQVDEVHKYSFKECTVHATVIQLWQVALAWELNGPLDK